MSVHIKMLSTAHEKHDETLNEMRKIQARLDKEHSLHHYNSEHAVNSREQHTKSMKALSNHEPFKGYSTLGSLSRQRYDQARREYSNLRHVLNTKRQIYERREANENDEGSKHNNDNDAVLRTNNEKDQGDPTGMDKILEMINKMKQR